MTDTDDELERSIAQREGGLQDELGGRVLRYRKALEDHRLATDDELVRLAAMGYVPEQYRANARLALSWRNVREARDLLEAARDALLRHRSA